MSGNSFDISYSVSDDVGLSWVELWRTNDKNGQPDENGWTQIGPQYSISGKSYSGEFHDSPSLSGIYWYGIHVVDTSGLCSVEPDPPGPIMVTVTDEKGRLAVRQLWPADGAWWLYEETPLRRSWLIH